MKDADNPVTIADLTIQKTMENVLLSFYPTINIIGEEDPATYAHIKPLVAVSDVRKDAITDEFLSKNFDARKELINQSKLLSQFYFTKCINRLSKTLKETHSLDDVRYLSTL